VRVEADGTLVLAFADPTNLQIADDVRIVLGEPFRIAVGDPAAFETALARAYRRALRLVELEPLVENEEAVDDIRDMGVEPELVASSLNCIVAQRLARRLCLECRGPYETSGDDLLPGIGADTVTLYRSRGCPRCAFTGPRRSCRAA
jgi:Type II secretion system (T2SS), protein E, N-terminal domain